MVTVYNVLPLKTSGKIFLFISGDPKFIIVGAEIVRPPKTPVVKPGAENLANSAWSNNSRNLLNEQFELYSVYVLKDSYL